MSTFSFDPEDPRLTAYALGEMTDPADRAQVEELLAASPEARAELADIRALTAALTAEYAQELAASAAEPPGNVVALPTPGRRRFRLPVWVPLAAVLVAAAFAAFLALPVHRSMQVKGGKTVAAASPAGPPAVMDPAQSLAMDAAARGEEQRTLVIPLGMPTPAVLPPGVTSVERGPAPVAGVAGGNPSAADGSNTGSPLLAQSDKDRQDALLDAIPPAEASARLALAPPPPTGQGVDAYRGSVAVAAGHATAAAPLPARPLSFAGPVASRQSRSMMMAQTKPAPRLAAAADSVTDGLATEAVVEENNVARSLAVPDESDADEPGKKAAVRRPLENPFGDQAFNTADYAHAVENKFLPARENPLSTFSVDVDTASYSIVRRFIDAGSLPPKDAVRVEEMLNYFPYSYAPPAPESDKPFAIHLEAAACPWNPDHRLVRIGLKGKEIEADKRPPSNLVFLLDVSGSMMPPERLPLIKQCLRLLVEKLREDDHVAIVVYAGESGLALPSTSGDHKERILRAIDSLHAGGSTNGAAGIKLAYQVARKSFLKGGTNRVILSTDGDFNVGTTSRGELLRLIEEERKDGIFLSVLGVGTDNLKDSTMQVLADHGNGNYAYLDRLEEGKKVLVDQMSGTLVTIAKDVKIQVEFNPATVAAYRLIGYEKRLLKKEDFNDDRVDAGEIGAGHSVTALYEIVPAGQAAPGSAPAVDALKYQPPVPDVHPTGAAPAETAKAAVAMPAAHELLTVKIRHKTPESDTSERTYEVALEDRGAPGDYGNASPDFQFAAAVASFGMVLRDSPYKGNATLGSALELAESARGEDPGGYRAGFIELIRQTQALEERRR